jgi:hypothetical protein
MPEDRETSDDQPERSEPPGGEFEYKGRQIHYQERPDGRIVLTIDGIAIPEPTHIGAQYYTVFFPFRGYPSIEAIAKALVDTEGASWTLRRDSTEQPE